jgi:hypothetical protein
MIELLALGSEARLDVSQTFPPSKLGECHASKLIGTTETLNGLVTLVAFDAAPKCVHGQVIHNLRKDKFALVHCARLPAPPESLAEAWRIAQVLFK